MSSSRSRPSILIIWILSLAAVEALSATKAEARAPGKFFSFHYTRQSIGKERERGFDYGERMFLVPYYTGAEFERVFTTSPRFIMAARNHRGELHSEICIFI